ncbi:MAG: helix-turn-helix domain-containing protein [Patescibacteria group bacterium]
MQEATLRLLELGLTDKEAKVYMAMLELGPSSVQDIAKKSGVNRSTSYLTLEGLKLRGLVSSATRGKKTLYCSESPNRLASLLNRERDELDSKKLRLQESIPYFMALYNAFEDKPQVRFFESEEGIVAARELMLRLGGEYLSFTAIDESTQRLSKINVPQRLGMARKKHGRYIFSLKPGFARPKSDLTNWEVRELPYGQFPFTGEINIAEDKVAAFVGKRNPLAFVVENREMAELFRAMFNAAWQIAKPVAKDKYVEK